MRVNVNYSFTVEAMDGETEFTIEEAERAIVNWSGDWKRDEKPRAQVSVSRSGADDLDLLVRRSVVNARVESNTEPMF